VSSYSNFIPYCQRSDVTKWSQPDKTYGRRWPGEGRLTVGFGGFEEQFTSRVYCIPGRAVESVGGQTETSLPAAEIQHHLGDAAIARSEEVQSGLLTHLRSLWRVEARGKDTTDVRLELEFAFANPMYTALSAGAAPRVADKMIEAFESRVRSLLDNNPTMARASLEQLGSGEPKR
jgi:coenzyme Q-binding protein COQ10